VVVRALGPSLQQAGVTDALADPVLELHSGDGSLLATNDNWKDNLAQQQQDITNNHFASPNDLEPVRADQRERNRCRRGL